MNYEAHKDQLLIDHLTDVGEMASEFAAAFDGREHANQAGLLHDLGKAEEQFQKRLACDDKDSKLKKEPHAHHGAALALENQAWPIAFAVNGHHAGLHDRSNVDRIRAEYLPKAEACLWKLRERHPQWSPPTISEPLPQWLQKLPFDARRIAEGWFATDVFTRFLFSALVDADSLNTEQHEQERDDSIAARKWPEFSPSPWLGVLRQELARRAAEAKEKKSASTEVQSVWAEVGAACELSAKESPGLFSLTVPTGGGKTLASMLFALAHAAHHNAVVKAPFRRIVVVIPYLSIIQQTVRELREIFGDNVILEHHSQAEDRETKVFAKEKHDGAIDDGARHRRVAAENWDAPIIVTTSVQFFGSLFSRRRSAARKLHNLCQSVVIFDEVQTLPPLLMQPILSVLAELTNPKRPYGCTMVFCTATQPALGKSESLPCGLTDVRPIVPTDSVRQHFKALQRVHYEWPADSETLSYNQLANRIVDDANRTDQQALAIVNTRQAARELHSAVASKLRGASMETTNAAIDGLFHLSTWMIPSHRDEVLTEVKRRLTPNRDQNHLRKQRCILISTQCIEAGVDVDFLEVWRAFGPYDSIVQAAGRCNRRGLRPTKGVVHVFRPTEQPLLRGVYGTATSQTDLLRRIGRAEPNDPESFTDYFRLLYQLSVPDECLIQKQRAKLHFEQVDELFKFIDDNTFPVLVLSQRISGVPDDLSTPASEVYEAARRRGFFVREDWRRLQPFLINLLQSSQSRPPFNEFISPAFDSESGLWIWTGTYLGGLDGVGIAPLGTEDYIV